MNQQSGKIYEKIILLDGKLRMSELWTYESFEYGGGIIPQDKKVKFPRTKVLNSSFYMAVKINVKFKICGD